MKHCDVKQRIQDMNNTYVQLACSYRFVLESSGEKL